MKTIEQIETTTDLTRKGTCVEFFSAYQDLDIDRMVGLFTANATIDFKPLGESGKGKVNELGRGLWSALIDAFPDLDNTIDTFDVNGEAIICQVVIFGTQTKEFAGIPSKGLKFESDHVFVFEFNEEDKVTSISVDWDHASFTHQLGVI